ncbi:MAG: DUF2075 domain-containing protein [Thermoplasmatales archaeon]
MKLYEGITKQFIQDATHGIIADKLKDAYEAYYLRRPNQSEVNSWRNSLRVLKDVLESSKLTDNGIILEYELPYSTMRLDCMLFGFSNDGSGNAVIIELKQWENVKDCDIQDNVLTFVGGRDRLEPHPSCQVREYHFYVKDFISLFEEIPQVNLSSCSYCHNYSVVQQNPILLLHKFNEVLKEFPLFGKEDFEKLGTYLKDKLAKGNGLELLNRFSTSNIRPTKKLLEHTSKVIKGEKIFHLIDDQLVAYNTILDRAKKTTKSSKKSVIIVRGGPGTGKSVIALNIMAELLTKNKDLSVFHATGSAAFTTTLRKIVGTRAAKLFKYFNSFSSKQIKENELDVLVCDEAHRIRKTSNSRYTKRIYKSELPQVDELIRAAKLSIFFIDDYQIVRPDEIGSTQLIQETAQKFNAEIFDFELKTQFRCSGSDGYMNWIDNTLDVRETNHLYLTKNEKMDFKIFDSPTALYEAIKAKNTEKANSARLVAGFCWPWSNPNPDGTLKKDIVIGDFKMTWEAKNNAAKLAFGIPKAALWAYDPNGVTQVGSIYTIQGFEFDYIGVIFGKDLTYDSTNKKWIGNPKSSADSQLKKKDIDFLKYVKNIYRVLLTRGMKGCYVYFMDKNTEEFFKSRIQI